MIFLSIRESRNLSPFSKVYHKLKYTVHSDTTPDYKPNTSHNKPLITNQ